MILPTIEKREILMVSGGGNLVAPAFYTTFALAFGKASHRTILGGGRSFRKRKDAPPLSPPDALALASVGDPEINQNNR